MNEFDIGIELHFTRARAFPAQLLLGTIEATERAIAKTERDEIDALEKEFSDLPPALFDAMRYRVQKLTGRALNFESASAGSIILAGVAAALAYWLLDKTLGETVKQAWQDSDLHSRIKQFMCTRVASKAKKIAGDIRPSRWGRDDASVEVITEKRGGQLVIIVLVVPGPEMSALPSAGDLATRATDGSADRQK